jgi:hypothetical protein
LIKLEASIEEKANEGEDGSSGVREFRRRIQNSQVRIHKSEAPEAEYLY